MASGVLPICLGQATKLSTFLLGAEKAYRVTGTFGIKTDTGDADGEIVKRVNATPIDVSDWQRVMTEFTGEIEQVPPMYSALKYKGQPLYKLARQGVEVEREARPVHIYEMTLEHIDSDTVVFDVRCSKGTYVRTLLEDMAVSLGTVAHVTALRRRAAGPYVASQAITIAELEALAEDGLESLDSSLLPVDSAIADWPEVCLPESAAFYLMRGQAVSAADLGLAADDAGSVRIYDENGRFMGIGEITADRQVAPKRLFPTE